MISDPNVTKYIEINGTPTPIWIYGDEKKYPLLFIHGYFRGFSDYIGDLPIRYLMKNYCIYAFDHSGYGESQPLKIDPLVLIKQIKDEFIKDRKYSIFGLSYGGAIALNFANKYPKNLEKVIIAGMPYYSRIKPWPVLRLVPFKPFKFKEMVEAFSKLDISKVKKPVLLLYGDKDRSGSVRMGRKLSKDLDAELIVAKDRNHGWLLHRIDETGFLSAINSFLK